jgi:hypothetical protein
MSLVALCGRVQYGQVEHKRPRARRGVHWCAYVCGGGGTEGARGNAAPVTAHPIHARAAPSTPVHGAGRAGARRKRTSILGDELQLILGLLNQLLHLPAANLLLNGFHLARTNHTHTP